jgi:hypothetical protein
VSSSAELELREHRYDIFWLLLFHWRSLEYLKIRAQRTKIRGKLVTDTQPGFHPHALECLNELCSFLAARYPSLYKVTRCSFDAEKEETWGDSIAGQQAGAVIGVENSATKERFEWKEECEREGEEWNPMRVAGCRSRGSAEQRVEGAEADALSSAVLVPDDLALMVEDENGEYLLRGGSIATAGKFLLPFPPSLKPPLPPHVRSEGRFLCELGDGSTPFLPLTPRPSSGSWRLEDKIGRTLHLIHTQGHDVPGWRDMLKSSMERFFVRMRVDKPVERNNVRGHFAWVSSHFADAF